MTVVDAVFTGVMTRVHADSRGRRPPGAALARGAAAAPEAGASSWSPGPSSGAAVSATSRAAEPPSRRAAEPDWLDRVRARPRLRTFLGAALPVGWVTVLLLLPYLFLFAHSFFRLTNGRLTHELTLENYRRLFGTPALSQHDPLLRRHRGTGDHRLPAARLPAGLPAGLQGQATQEPDVHGGDHSALGQLPGAGLCLEDHPGPGRDPERFSAVGGI